MTGVTPDQLAAFTVTSTLELDLGNGCFTMKGKSPAAACELPC